MWLQWALVPLWIYTLLDCYFPGLLPYRRRAHRAKCESAAWSDDDADAPMNGRSPRARRTDGGSFTSRSVSRASDDGDLERASLCTIHECGGEDCCWGGTAAVSDEPPRWVRGSDETYVDDEPAEGRCEDGESSPVSSRTQGMRRGHHASTGGPGYELSYR